MKANNCSNSLYLSIIPNRVHLCLPVGHLLLNILQAFQISLVTNRSFNVPSSFCFFSSWWWYLCVPSHTFHILEWMLTTSHVHLLHPPTSHIIYKICLKYAHVLSTLVSSLWPSCHLLPDSLQKSANRSVLHLPSISCLPYSNSFFCLTAILSGTKSEMLACPEIPALALFSALSHATLWFICTTRFILEGR